MYFKGLLAEKGVRYQPQKSEYEVRSIRKYRLVPSKRLIARLGLTAFDRPAPLSEDVLVPQTVRIYTRQHVGAPAAPCVGVGEHVAKGQLIGHISAEALGAAIHSSIDGVVSAVTHDYIEVRSV